MNRIALALFAVVAVGCSAGESQVVGRWKGDIQMSEADRKVPLSNIASGFASTMQLDVKADHTFQMTAFIVPVEGTWKMNGRQVVFTPKEVFGFKSEEQATAPNGKESQGQTSPFTLELSADGKTLSAVENEPSKQSAWRFVKEAS